MISKKDAKFLEKLIDKFDDLRNKKTFQFPLLEKVLQMKIYLEE